jgi:hypothetical protein
MAKKIVYILLGALLIFGLLFLLWSWFFSGTKTGSLNSGQFGTASDTSQTSGGTTPGGNYTLTLGQGGTGQNSANGSIPLNGTGGTNGVNGNTSGTNGTGGTNGVNGNTSGTNGTGGTSGVNGNTSGTNGTGGTNGAGTGALIQLNGGGTLGIGGLVNGGPGTIGTNPNGNLNGSSTLINNTLGITTVPGVIWLGGTNSGSAFTPADINSVSSDAGGFTPTITTAPPASSGGTTLVEALAATAIAGGLTCALQSAVAATNGAGATAATASAIPAPFPGNPVGYGFLVTGTGPLVVADYGLRANAAAQTARNTAKDNVPVVTCLVNVIAKTALQQITISVVNWINSGFNGQPSFVTNYEQFFTNVADLSAGQFIQGSGLAFLCSPFKLQIKIAIAQSYANRGAQSCSLTGIINNITNFMNGSFTQAGWPGLLQFTTVPTNNPYGAFAYAQVGLATAQSNAAANAKNNISPTGFLNLQQLTGCDNPANNGIGVGGSIGTNLQVAAAAGKNALPSGCKPKTVTPGGVIADSLGAVNKSGVDQLGIGNDIDQIISALTTQLITKTLQSGLASLSQTQGTTQTAADLAAQQQAASLLIDMQGKVSIAQQIGSIDQGSISDIEDAQNNLNNLVNCWSGIATSSTNAVAAAQNAATASSTLHSLNTQVDGYNNNITNLNAEIATIGQFEAQMSSAASDADVATAAASYNAAIAGGTFASQNDVTTAQQNRTTLQSQMGALNQSTATSLTQCQAAH